jgi:hypothetical protein
MLKKGLLCLCILLVPHIAFIAAQYVDDYTWLKGYEQKQKNANYI